jgi:dTDP-4-dehydrorhamnose 3,5-epimerase
MNPYHVEQTGIEGCFEIVPRIFGDSRGRFIKLFHCDQFAEHGLTAAFEESYYAVSTHGVLRGLHFQSPPDDHVKLVTCLSGSILDVVVDLRKASTTYLQVRSFSINAEKGNMLYVPEGLAHGYYVESKECIFLSFNSRKYSPECDAAIRWNSINFSWPDPDPVVSDKDRNAISLEDYKSPF